MTIIHYTPRKFSYTLTCSHCKTRFETNEIDESFSGKGYSARCPICGLKTYRRFPKGNRPIGC